MKVSTPECIVVDPDSDPIESLNFSISEGSESLSDYEILVRNSDADISDWSIDENTDVKWRRRHCRAKATLTLKRVQHPFIQGSEAHNI